MACQREQGRESERERSEINFFESRNALSSLPETPINSGGEQARNTFRFMFFSHFVVTFTENENIICGLAAELLS